MRLDVFEMILKFIKFVNRIILLMYIVFMLKNNISYNLLTITPIATIFIIEYIAKVIVKFAYDS